MLVLAGDAPLVDGPTLQALVDAHPRQRRRRDAAERRAPGPEGLRADRPRRRRRRRADRRDEGGGRRDARGAGHRGGQRERLRLRRRRAARRARAAEHRQRAGRAVPHRHRVDPARRRPRGRGAHRRGLAGRARGERPRRPRGGPGAPAAPHPRGAHALRGHRDRPRDDLRGRGRRDRPRRGARADDGPARRDAHRRRLAGRPVDDAHRRPPRRRRDDPQRARRRRRAARRRDGRPVRVPAAGHGAPRGVQGGHVRRAEELRHRRGHEGAASLLPGRRRRRPGHEHRRRERDRQLRRRAQAPHDDRQGREDGRGHDVRRARCRSATTPGRAPGRSCARTCRPARWRSAFPRRVIEGYDARRRDQVVSSED